MQNAVLGASKAVRTRRAMLVLSGVVLCSGAAAQDSSAPVVAQGEQIYKSARCYACHGEYGYGGAGPRFRQDHFLGVTDYVVGQILVGRGIMPSFANTLDNAQIAKVASYIRSSWGNDFGDVKPDEVVQVRKDLEEKAPPAPHASASEQPPGAPAPPAGGQSPGQALPPANMR